MRYSAGNGRPVDGDQLLFGRASTDDSLSVRGHRGSDLAEAIIARAGIGRAGGIVVDDSRGMLDLR